MVRRLALRIVLVLLVGSGCEPGPPPTTQVDFSDAVTVTDGCERLGPEPERCAAVIDEARLALDLRAEDVTETSLLTEDRCGPTREELCSRSGSFVAGVQFTLTDGSIRWATVVCLPDSPAPSCPR